MVFISIARIISFVSYCTFWIAKFKQKKNRVASSKGSFNLQGYARFGNEKNFLTFLNFYNFWEKRYPYFPTRLRDVKTLKKREREIENERLRIVKVEASHFIYIYISIVVWPFFTKLYYFKLSTIFHCHWYSYAVHCESSERNVIAPVFEIQNS